ncbi:MAG: hypothetical protein ACK5MQ_04360 [Pikeienuella sp.]
MDRLALLAIGLVFGGGLGFVSGGMGAGGMGMGGHDHGAMAPLDLPAGPEAPGVEMTLTPDPVSGWTLHAEVRNFRFAPEKAGMAAAPGEGHAHIHVDGMKIARLYGPWAHLAALPEGAKVMVSLNANDHRPLSVEGAPVAAMATAP